MQGKRTGKLTDEETYRLVYERNAVVREIAQMEGVLPQAIYLRLARERQRREAVGLSVHRRARGRKPALPKGFVVADDAGVALAGSARVAAANEIRRGLFDSLTDAIERLDAIEKAR